MNRLDTEREPLAPTRLDGFQFSVLRGLSPERDAFERLLLGAGIALPLPHRTAWAALQPRSQESWLLCVRDAAGRACGAAGLQVLPSRALPGHRLLRVERFGPGMPVAAQGQALEALVAMARRNRRVLRLYVETFAPQQAERASLEAEIETLGFTRSSSPRCYEHTLVLPLDGDEASLLASFHATGRRHIRAAGKHPVTVRTIVDPEHFSRLDELSRETFARTGGQYDPPDWSSVVTLCEREPGASRLVGLYRTDADGPASLLAFAWGCGHGDHVHYANAASTRETDLRIPLMYPVVWDLIRWAKRSGARYFDFGGITTGTHDSADRLGGISDFKRYFTERVVHVGAEWSLEPRPIQAQAARMVKSASSMLSRVLARA